MTKDEPEDIEVLYLRRRGIFARLDVFPFAVAYAVGFTLLNIEEHRIAGFVIVPIALLVQIVVFLLSQSAVTFKARIAYSRVKDIEKASNALVQANGKWDIVDLSRSTTAGFVKILDTEYRIPKIFFEHKKLVFCYNEKTERFTKMSYPNSGSCESFLSHIGYASTLDVSVAGIIWGKNEFDIPIPGFLDLYVGHLVAPFFVFQVLCLFLWSLDDYWYYSFLTLLMLMFFEGLQCKQRLNSVIMLRNMRKPPMQILVYRTKKWVSIRSDDLLPGDVVSLSAKSISGSSSQDDCYIPCDALLIHGSCVLNEAMLTGESVPQVKESISVAMDALPLVDLGLDEGNVSSNWKRHMVFGGTQLLQNSYEDGQDGEDSTSAGGQGSSSSPMKPPDNGSVAVVIRTSFRSTQGSLMRKILFASENIIGDSNSSETFRFIAILVVLAIIAASIVLYYGLGDSDRNKFRLSLHCVMIITSVVPPELPMELSLAVTTSLSILAKSLVFCTEPYRIAYAGKVTTLCFDKTGTLTKDEMVLRGVVRCHDQHDHHLQEGDQTGDPDQQGDQQGDQEGANKDRAGAKDRVPFELESPGDCPPEVQLAMAACQGLFLTEQGVVGDPLEVAAVAESSFRFQQESVTRTAVVRPEIGLLASILHRYPFSSDLKRMSTVVRVVQFSGPLLEQQSPGGPSPVPVGMNTVIFTKGAPEVVQGMLGRVPGDYQKAYQHHMRRGRRVIALASRTLTGTDASQASLGKMPRSQAEAGLTFVGFLVFDCELKPDSKSVMRELSSSGHRTAMITGDSAFTAIDVAKKLSMLRKFPSKQGGQSPSEYRVALLRRGSGPPGHLEYEEALNEDSGDTSSPVLHAVGSPSSLRDLWSVSDLCVTGDALSSLIEAGDRDMFTEVCLRTVVFSRVSPEQKESIVRCLNQLGEVTGMVGDGTNDVGALKAAHVGISIVNDPSLENRLKHVRDGNSGGNSGAGGGVPGGTPANTSRDRMMRAMAELQEQERDPSLVQLGDASIASPFTARRTSIDAVLTVLRSGRCTLVTTIQVYKVLALTCLVSAYNMSTLYLKGLKSGDVQMTVQGLISAGLFYFLSQAKPLLILSQERPPTTVFHRSVMLSIIGQCVVHMASIVFVMASAAAFIDPNDPSLSPDGKFHPNVINSSLFLLSSIIQVNSFVTNYRGYPFTERLENHVMLFRSVIAIYAVILIITGGQFEPLNDFLQIAPFPSASFQGILLVVFIANFGASYLIEQMCRKL